MNGCGICSKASPRHFAIVCVLGPPGAGKGSVCKQLANEFKLAHYSVGDDLRKWMQDNAGTALAVQIQDKLDNQGFLSSEDLNPLISQAIKIAMHQDDPLVKGILLDGFPRCMAQLESFDDWPFQNEIRLIGPPQKAKPDIVLTLRVEKQNAKARYVTRARDSNDSHHKFDRRFNEYEMETKPVEDLYEERAVLVTINGDGTKEEVICRTMGTLKENNLWQKVVVEGRTDSQLDCPKKECTG